MKKVALILLAAIAVVSCKKKESKSQQSSSGATTSTTVPPPPTSTNTPIYNVIVDVKTSALNTGTLTVKWGRINMGDSTYVFSGNKNKSYAITGDSVYVTCNMPNTYTLTVKSNTATKLSAITSGSNYYKVKVKP